MLSQVHIYLSKGQNIEVNFKKRFEKYFIQSQNTELSHQMWTCSLAFEILSASNVSNDQKKAAKVELPSSQIKKAVSHEKIDHSDS